MLDQYDTEVVAVISDFLSSEGAIPAPSGSSVDTWLRAALKAAMSSDSNLPAAIDAMLASLLAQQPASLNEKQAIDAAVAALMRVKMLPPPGTRPPAAPQPISPDDSDPAPAPPPPSVDPVHSPYYGMGLREACFKRLNLVPHKQAQTARQIWEALALVGFKSAHIDPPHSVQSALARRAQRHGDVLLVGSGKWALKSWYTDEELEEIKGSLDGMPGRDRGNHKERTKEGMLVARSRGAESALYPR